MRRSTFTGGLSGGGRSSRVSGMGIVRKAASSQSPYTTRGSERRIQHYPSGNTPSLPKLDFMQKPEQSDPEKNS